MKQIVITHENGVELVATKTIAIEPEKIVSTKAIGGVCEFVYAGTIDRRVAPKAYRVSSTKTQIDALVTGTQVSFSVYDEADGTVSTLDVTEKFIEEMRATTHMINNTATSCVQVKFREGAWLQQIIYVSGALSDFADAAPTTTTTTTAAATTTTTAAATTTTTAAATTTTTAAATTTTTAAVTTTTTTGGA